MGRREKERREHCHDASTCQVTNDTISLAKTHMWYIERYQRALGPESLIEQVEPPMRRIYPLLFLLNPTLLSFVTYYPGLFLRVGHTSVSRVARNRSEHMFAAKMTNVRAGPEFQDPMPQ